MTDTSAPLTIVSVHAHPDDESIATGLVLAKAVRLGHNVHNITCTMGEEGEVIGDEFARLVTTQQRPDGTGLLGGYRIAELQRALTCLGLEDGPTFLGGVGQWRDSGMDGTPPITYERAFSNKEREASFTEQVAQLSELLLDLQPDIVITYGPDGGYGHPDHIRAHHVTHAAIEQMAPADQPRQLLWCVSDRQAINDGLAGIAEDDIPEGWSFGELAAVDPSEVAFSVEGSDEDVAAKAAAMAEHATQIVVDGPVFALSNLIVQPLLNTEAYTVAFTAEGVEDNFAEKALS